MTVQWSREFLNRYVAPGIHDFDRAEIPELMGSRGWMFDHFMKSVSADLSGVRYGDLFRERAINCIYRVQTAIRGYQEAAALTASYLSKSQPGSPVISLYFETLSKWEMCILKWQMFVEVYNSLAPPEEVFKSGDKSPDEQAYEIANSIKHSGKRSRRAGSGGIAKYTVPMWLTNDGLQTRSHKLSYKELTQLLTQAGEFVQHIIDPKT